MLPVKQGIRKISKKYNFQNQDPKPQTLKARNPGPETTHSYFDIDTAKVSVYRTMCAIIHFHLDTEYP